MPRDTKPKSTQGIDSKKKQTKSSNKQDEVVWGGFINIKIDDETKVSFTSWLEEVQNAFWLDLENVVSSGLKFGLSWDSENECYITTFVGCGVVGSNERYCLTARAGRLDEAIALLVFKHIVMARSDWGGFMPHNGTMNNWG